MLEAKTPKSKKRAARRATPARKAGSPRSESRGAVEDVMIAAQRGDLPGALFFVASAGDETFEEIKRRAFALDRARIEAGGSPPRATMALVNAVVLSRRLRLRSGA